MVKIINENITKKNNVFFWDKVRASHFRNHCNIYLSELKIAILYDLSFLDRSSHYTKNYNILRTIANNAMNRNLYYPQGFYEQKIDYLVGKEKKGFIFIDTEDTTIFELDPDILNFCISEYFYVIYLNNLNLSNYGIRQLKQKYLNLNVIPYFDRIYIQKDPNTPINSIEYLSKEIKVQEILLKDSILKEIDFILKSLPKKNICNEYVEFYGIEAFKHNISTIDQFDKRIEAFILLLKKFIDSFSS